MSKPVKATPSSPSKKEASTEAAKSTKKDSVFAPPGPWSLLSLTCEFAKCVAVAKAKAEAEEAQDANEDIELSDHDIAMYLQGKVHGPGEKDGVLLSQAESAPTKLEPQEAPGVIECVLDPWPCVACGKEFTHIGPSDSKDTMYCTMQCLECTSRPRTRRASCARRATTIHVQQQSLRLQ